jgi:SpoVK/Ycf46/Vps4 family AAA+-type ATPase
MRSTNLTFLKSIVLAKLAQMTNGYVAADLMALCREATMVAIEQWMHSHGDVENDTR